MGKQGRFICGVEGGGTKFNCAIATSPINLTAQTSIPTTTPDETLFRIREFFAEQARQHGPASACGLAIFGPLELDARHAEYGTILGSPKLGWQGFDIVSALRDASGAQVALDTDVNAAALAESRYGAAKGARSTVYITVGTGIGTGIVRAGKTMQTPLHPEGGHMYVPRDKSVDDFAGVCPFHNDCVEGLASGVAMEARWGMPATELPDEHPGWLLEAGYLALMCINIFRILAPEVIVLGGGVMNHKGLLEMVRQRFSNLAGGFHMPRGRDMEELIVSPGLGNDAGLVGALILTENVLELATVAPPGA